MDAPSLKWIYMPHPVGWAARTSCQIPFQWLARLGSRKHSVKPRCQLTWDFETCNKSAAHPQRSCIINPLEHYSRCVDRSRPSHHCGDFCTEPAGSRFTPNEHVPLGVSSYSSLVALVLPFRNPCVRSPALLYEYSSSILGSSDAVSYYYNTVVQGTWCSCFLNVKLRKSFALCFSTVGWRLMPKD